MVDSRSHPPKLGEQGIFNIGIEDPADRIQDYLDGYRLDPGYDGPDRLIFHHIKIISAKLTEASQDGMEARVVFELEIVPGLCNSMGNCHGGAVAMLADNTTTAAAAPVAREGFWVFGGVSRTLSITYLRPLPQGSTVVIENMVRSVGKTLSTIQCVMRDKATGKILALGEHGKAALDAQVKRRASGLL